MDRVDARTNEGIDRDEMSRHSLICYVARWPCWPHALTHPAAAIVQKFLVRDLARQTHVNQLLI